MYTIVINVISLQYAKKELSAHSDNSHKDYQCNICVISFWTRKEYFVHKKENHKRRKQQYSVIHKEQDEKYRETSSNIEKVNQELLKNIENEYFEDNIKEESPLELELSLEMSSVSSGAVFHEGEQQCVIKDEAVSESGEATYVCPIDSCTFMTKMLTDTFQSEHYGACHPDVDTVNMKFITLS